MSRMTSDRLVRITVLIILVLGVSNIVYQIIGNNAIDTLKHSSEHGDCKTTATSDAEDTFRHDLAKLLDAASHDRLGDVQQLAKKMENTARTADVIAATCPSLSGSISPPPTSTSTSPSTTDPSKEQP